MFNRSKTQAVKESAASGTDLAVSLAQDKKFRKQLLSAVGHGAAARERAASRIGLIAAAHRLGTDKELRDELRQMTEGFQNAWTRVEKKRSHKLRNFLLVIGGIGAAVAATRPQARKKVSKLGDVVSSGPIPRTITETIEVDVPVSTAYNQWTQFEEFPKFMDGVNEVRQLDDTRLHWDASVAGKRAEWDAKIVEQEPDTRIVWESIDGKQTRGTVAFDKLGESRTNVRLTMSYTPEGIAEKAGSAIGLDRRRIKGDLGRFKELIESRGVETGAWRGEIQGGVETA